MNPVYDGLGQEIKVGDFVAMAQGSYVNQLFGFVTKLGNKGNARVSRSDFEGQFIDASGLVVINSLLSNLPKDVQGKYAALKVEASKYFTEERPKASKAPRYRVFVNEKTGLAYVISFQNEYEKHKKMGDIDVSGYHCFNLRRVSRGYFTKTGRDLTFTRFGATNKELDLPFKVIRELDLISYIDFEDGFDYTTTELNKIFV